MRESHVPEHLARAAGALNEPARRDAARQRFAFLLVPGFSFIGFASGIEPLRIANMVAGRALYAAVTVGVGAGAVRASNGVATVPDCSIETMPRVDALFVCGPNPIAFPEERRLVRWLRGLAHGATALGGIDTGSYLLARAGLLAGYRATIHWQDREPMLERFPGTVLTSGLFEIDRDRYTSSGGNAAMHMMLALIARAEGGRAIAAAVADLLVHDTARGGAERQRVPLRRRLGMVRTKLEEAATIMESNLEEPVRLPEIARYVALSERQLERLFREHLGCTPSRYYLELRLTRARRRLLSSADPVARIAAECGFASTSHFIKCYARLFGASPGRERRRGELHV